MSFFAQALESRHAQLAGTAVVSGVAVATAILSYQQHAHTARVRQLKQSIGGVEEEERGGVERTTAAEDTDVTAAAVDPEDARTLAMARRAQAGDYDEEVILEQLTRNRAFLTPAGLELVREAVVVIVGCGGVGSHCAAALARSGVSRLRLVDFDQVSLSSLNRHAVATLADVGRPKVRVLARRLQAVVPWVRFDLRGEKFDAAAAPRLLGEWVDEGSNKKIQTRPISFIVDAIDNIDTKVELLRYCHENGLPVIASMGAGTKSDPTRVTVGDIGSSAEDRLSRATRRRLKLLGITSGIPAVYSTEPAGQGKATLLPLAEEQFAQGKEAVRELGALPDFRVRILPVLGTMPAVFGYTLANHILLELSGYPHEYSTVKGREKLYEQILGFVHSTEEKLVRHREERELASAADSTTDSSSRPKKAAPQDSAAYGLRMPLTSGDVAFLLEDVYRGRSVVSGLPTRTTLIRWQFPASDDGSSSSTILRISAGGAGDSSKGAVDDEQRSVRIGLADLVCMTREEAARHQTEVLLGGKLPAELYDAETLERVAARQKEAAEYEKFR